MGEGIMVSFTRTHLRIGEIIKLEREGKLVLQPKFQRRLVWEDKARSYLIDTVVRDLPMPKIYLRRAVLPKTKLAGYEVVDGQQRLRAILDFHQGLLVLSHKHNTEFGDATFSSLPDPVQRVFLSYQLSTDIMENATDPEVWAMFERLNSYTLVLNRQEKRNARFFGYFKQTAYGLAAEQTALDAWRNLRVFGNRPIARMAEVELTSDVMVAILHGISDITDITPAYEKYDDEFPRRKFTEDTFKKTLSWIANSLADAVRKTRFRNRTWFYSLMVAAVDTLVGIPDGKGPGKPRSSKEIQKRMFDLDAALKPVMLPPGLGALNDALSRQTSHIPPRRVRHEHFFDLLNLSQDAWSARWKELTSVPQA
jgi:Protein of unknown function DUF262